MAIKLTKGSIDLGIVAADPDACLVFYRDVLRLEDLGQTEIPGGTMHRLGCGSSILKIISLRKPPADKAAPGGLRGATGYRYWTLSVADLEQVVADCEAAGRRIPVGPTELRPGVSIAMVEDPDGNWVELLSEG